MSYNDVIIDGFIALSNMSQSVKRILTICKRNCVLPLIQTRRLCDNQASGKNVPPVPKENLPPISELLQNELVLPLIKKEKTDPDDTTVLLFPGQGSQYVGMVDDLLDYPNVRDMFNIASDILHFDLLNYCQNGPQQELDKTVHCQPAVMLASLAAVEKLQVRNNVFSVVIC